jgi:hypothetical protein
MNKELLKNIYQKEDTGDISIITKIVDKTDLLDKPKTDTKKRKVYSFILKETSPVFKKMLSLNVQNKKKKEIDLTEYDPTLIECLLKFMHYEEITIFEDPIQNCKLLILINYFELFSYGEKVKYNICNIINEKFDEKKKSDLIIDYLNNLDTKLPICHEIFTLFLKYISKMLSVAVVTKTVITECFDLNSPKQPYRWCCLHKYKNLSNKYESYTIKQNDIPLYACICTKLISLGITKSMSDSYDLEGKSVIINDPKYYTHRCCQHNLIAYNKIIMEIYDYNLLIKLNEHIRALVIQNIF